MALPINCLHRGSSQRIMVVITAALLGLTACAPRQFGADQCPDINVNVTGALDAQHVGNDPAIDAIMNDFVAASPDVPGCALGVMKNNAIFYLKGYGDADLGDLAVGGDEIPWDVDTPSVVGSISKTLTALAILRLQEMQLLSIDDPVSDHLAMPAAWQGITITQLLAHTAGLSGFPTFFDTIDTEEELSEFLFPNLPAPILNLGIFPSLVYGSYLDTPRPGFAPGDTAAYSNTGYMVLGALIESVLSDNFEQVGVLSYERFVWREVGFFDQSLQSTDQLYSICLNEYWRQDDIPNLARGYSINNGGTLDGPITFFNSEFDRDGVQMSFGPAGWEGPAGGWTMTIGDLVRLMLAMENDLIVSSESRDQMLLNFTSAIPNNRGYGFDATKSFGLGVYRAKGNLPVGDPRNRLHYMHDGDYPGYAARFTVWPNEQFGVAIMCNGTGANVRSPTVNVAQLLIDAPAAGEPSLETALLIDELDPGDDPGLGIGPISRRIPDSLAAEESAFVLSRLQAVRSSQSLEERRQLEALALSCDKVFRIRPIDIFDTRTIPGQIAECADTTDRHGAFMRCVNDVTKTAVELGQISGPQKGRINTCVALSNFGRDG